MFSHVCRCLVKSRDGHYGIMALDWFIGRFFYVIVFFFGFRWQAVEGKRNRARKTAMGVMNARFRVHLARERLSSLNLVPRAFPLKNGWGTHFLREKPWGRG